MSEIKNVISQMSNNQSFESVPDIFSKVKKDRNPFAATMQQLFKDVRQGRIITNNDWAKICQIKDDLDYKNISTTDLNLTDIFDLFDVIKDKNDEKSSKTTLEEDLTTSYTKHCLIGTGCCLAGLALLSPLACLSQLSSPAFTTATLASGCASLCTTTIGVASLDSAQYVGQIKNIETDISKLKEKRQNIHKKIEVQSFNDECNDMMACIKTAATRLCVSPTNAIKLLDCYYQLQQLCCYPKITNTPSNKEYNNTKIKFSNNKINNNIVNNSQQKDGLS